MSYGNNNYSYGRRSFSSGGSNYRGYSSQRSDWRSGGGNRQPGKKRSGCTKGYSKGNQSSPYVRGWNASRRNGFTTIIAGPYTKTAKHTSKSGRVWENWCAKVQNGYGQPYMTSALYDVQTGRVMVQSLGFVMNPSKNFCGRFGTRK